jgi:hypothetical protein
MKRRGFFKTVLGGIAAGFIPLPRVLISRPRVDINDLFRNFHPPVINQVLTAAGTSKQIYGHLNWEPYDGPKIPMDLAFGFEDERPSDARVL